MTYIFGLIILGLLFLALHHFTELTHSEKISVITIILSIIAIAIMFNEYNKEQNVKMLDVVKRFNQNKTVKCGAVDVNNSDYTLSVGTYTFIGKENTPLYGEMISASDCE